MVLRDQGMSWDEIRVVSTTADRELIRRHLELHVERLEEWLRDQRRNIAAIERVLAEATQRKVGSAGRAS
jgi:Holliday junction resolvasome RuvABC endonuclease subunit